MSKWEMVRLGDVCDVRDGTHDSPKYMQEGYPLITSKNIINGKIDFDNVNYISEDDYNKINQRSFVDDGDILMPMIGTIGNSIIVDKTKEFAIKNVALIKFNNCITSNRYVNYCLKSGLFTKYVDKENRGGTQKFLSLNNIRKFTIPLPLLDIQKHIADILDKTQEIVDGHKKHLEELDNLIKAVFYDMFGDPIINDKNWEIKRLWDICDVRDGTHDSPKYVSVGYPLVTSKNVVGGTITFDDINYISKEDYDRINQRSKVDIGDIIMPMIGTIGKPVIVKTDKDFAIKNVALIKFNSSYLSNIYIQRLLSSSYFEIETQKKNKGGTQKFISLGDIRNLQVPVPPVDMQNKFAQIVTNIEEQKAIIKQSITESQNLFNSLMSKYFD